MEWHNSDLNETAAIKIKLIYFNHVSIHHIITEEYNNWYFLISVATLWMVGTRPHNRRINGIPRMAKYWQTAHK